MLSRAAREEKAQQWLERLRRWQADGGGVSLAQFSRDQGWRDFEAYRWARILRRQGRWDVAEPRANKPKRTRAAASAKFVRVRLASREAGSTPATPLTLRVQLANGRSGELQLQGTEQLLQVLAALEQPA